MHTHIKTNLPSIVSLLIILLLENPAIAQEIWGMTKYGGDYNKGVIFKIDEDTSSQEVVFSFKDMGLPEGKMTEYGEGVFYGMTSSEWDPSFGIIYRYESATGGFTEIMSFNGAQTGKDGPGSMILASNGRMYGMTASGGEYDKGVLFEFDPSTETFTKKIDFNGQEKGGEPLGSLIESSDGMLYGMTSMGGEHDAGTIFSYNFETGSFMKLIDFDGEGSGSNPMGSLTEASDGFLYGMTRWGGINNHGIIFRYNRENNKINTVFDFIGEETGRNPHGSLTEASNGKFYGIAPFGGPTNMGVLFEFDPGSNTFLIRRGLPKAPFVQSNGSLLEAPDKKLYGIVQNEKDTSSFIYSFDPLTGAFEKMGSFPENLGDYYGSMESLTLASNGKLFFWGRDAFYIDEELFLFEFDYELNEITNYHTNSSFSTGSYPLGQLVEMAKDSLLGLTGRGGKFDQGVIFLFNPLTNTYRKLIDFDGNDKGAAPTGSLVLADNSKLYGMTNEGGTANMGVLFEFDPVTTGYKKIIDFDGINTGGNPNGNLVQATNGKLYGMTISGGDYDYGVLFEFDPVSGAYRKLIDFEGTKTGYDPRRTLTQGSNGNLYGVTKFGGASNFGTLFEYNIETGIYNKLADCSNRPVAIMQASNNNLYISGYQKIFEYNPENNVYRQLETISTSGIIGRLLEVSEGVLWGMDFGEIAYQSGTEDRGMVFEINLKTNDSSVKTKFNGQNGRHPENSGLIKIRKDTAPVAMCIDTKIYLDENGQALLEPSDINNASKGDGIEFTLSKSSFNCEDIDENNITLTVTDENGNISTCISEVIVADTIPPVALCKDIEVFLDEKGTAEINGSDIDNGSFDACGIKAMTLNVTTFTCENIGENTVELTISDNNGNTSTCIAVVKVTDNIAPDISCPSGVTKYLNPYEDNYVIEGTTWDAEAADNCRIESLEQIINGDENSRGATLEGINLGAGMHNIEWLATDGGGNISSCTSTFTVEKRPTSLLILENEINREQEMVIIKAILMDDLLNQGIAGKLLVFAIDEKTQTAVTNEAGVATVTLPIDVESAGLYSLSARFDEDATYVSCNADSEIVTGIKIFSEPKVKVYPNPFTEKLYIEFTAPESAVAQINLFDAQGRLVKNIFNQPVVAGSFYKLEYSPHLKSSFLLYQIKIGKTVISGKILHGR